MDLGSNYNRLKESISDISDSLTAKEVNSVTGLSQVPDEIRKISTNKIYGVRIKKAESDPYKRVEYTDDAVGMTPITIDPSTGKAILNEWADSWILKHFYPVMLKTNGVENYRLNPNNNKQKLEGGTSDATNINYDGNAMVHIDKFYTNCWYDDIYEYIQVSEKKLDGFEPIGFIREDGTEMDYTYLPCYMGSFDQQNKLRSISGQAIKANTSYNNFVIAAQRNGITYGLRAYPQQTFMDFLYLIMFKNENSETALGAGRGIPSSTTGVTDSLGAIACDPSTKCTKFLYIEDFTLNSSGYEWMEGLLFQKVDTYIKMKRPYSSTSKNGYTYISEAAKSGIFIKSSVLSNQYGRIPTDCTGSEDTFQCDRFASATENLIYICSRAYKGVWARLSGNPSDSSFEIGASLSFEPPA